MCQADLAGRWVTTVRKTLVIRSDLREARTAEDTVLDAVAQHHYSDADAFAIKLALEEGLNNAIKHGNRCDPDKTVELAYDVSDEQAVFTITDQGPGFDPGRVPDPTADENLEKPCGRGIMLMRVYMDEVHYSQRGNQVCLLKRKS